MPLEITPAFPLSVGKYHVGLLDTGILSTLEFDMRNNQTSLSSRV